MKRTNFLQALVADLLLFGFGLTLHFVYGRTCNGADGAVIGIAVVLLLCLFVAAMEAEERRGK